MHKDDQEISTTHQEKSCDTSLNSHIMTTSTEIKDSSTPLSRSIKLNSANITWSKTNAHSLNIVSLLMDKKISDSQMM